MAAPASTRRHVLRDSTAFTSFSVKDLAQARTFYGDTLGLKVSDEKNMGLHVRLRGTELFIYPKDNHQPAAYTVLNFQVGDLDEAMDDLRSHGIRFEVYRDGPTRTDERGVADWPDGPRMAWFKDPAGNILSVIQEHR
jgi:catechol 2,3-dioxygenase-like lactoylglutathione lyase family enzyme